MIRKPGAILKNPIFQRQPPRPYARAHRISIAPMMDRTDPHWRRFARLFTKQAMLYTEMLPAFGLMRNLILRERETPFSVEHPVTVQLGGADENALATSAKISEDIGFQGINLNCGCPSPRVAANGKDDFLFGAALMRNPKKVAKLCAAMKKATTLPISVKCRLGVDNDDSYEFLHTFISTVAQEGGVDHFVVHARKAYLKGLSPAKNRTVPPIHYDRVHRLSSDFPNLNFTINGEFSAIAAISEQLERHKLHGVMIGRHAFQSLPFLASIDKYFYGVTEESPATPRYVLEHYADYCNSMYERGTNMTVLFRPVFPLFDGLDGSKKWRQELQVAATKQRDSSRVVDIHDVFKKAGRAIHPHILDMPLLIKTLPSSIPIPSPVPATSAATSAASVI